MSHISTYAIKIKDINTFLDVCKAKGYDVTRGEHVVKQFAANRINAVGSVLLPDWRYRIAITENGELKYDHYGSKPNTMETLGKTVQEYNKKVLDMEIPYEIQNYYTSHLENGDLEVILEY